MKILHSYLHKKGGEKVHKAIQGEAGESGKATVSTGSPGPKNKSCTDKNYISYLKKAAKGPSDQPWVSAGGPCNPETPGEQIPDKISSLKGNHKFPPPPNGRESDKRSNLIICLICRDWKNMTLKMYKVSEQVML